jgi:hypothetical protein
MSTVSADGGSFVKLKRLANGTYTWDVSVLSTSPTVEDLRLAKESARLIVAELEEELGPKKDSPSADQNGLPF